MFYLRNEYINEFLDPSSYNTSLDDKRTIIKTLLKYKPTKSLINLFKDTDAQTLYNMLDETNLLKYSTTL